MPGLPAPTRSRDTNNDLAARDSLTSRLAHVQAMLSQLRTTLGPSASRDAEYQRYARRERVITELLGGRGMG